MVSTRQAAAPFLNEAAPAPPFATTEPAKPFSSSPRGSFMASSRKALLGLSKPLVKKSASCVTKQPGAQREVPGCANVCK